MGVLKLIMYPVGSAFLALFVVTLVGMTVFGSKFSDWAPWQSDLVDNVGTIAGFIGVFLGLWFAVRSERQATR
jgi:hypothetical protein